jgi:hypothetical protein
LKLIPDIGLVAPALRATGRKKTYWET